MTEAGGIARQAEGQKKGGARQKEREERAAGGIKQSSTGDGHDKSMYIM